MFKYNVKIQKVSGRLNESVLPSKNLVVKSKTKKSKKQIFKEASNHYKKKYGLVVESVDIEELNSVTDAAREFCIEYYNELKSLNYVMERLAKPVMEE